MQGASTNISTTSFPSPTLVKQTNTKRTHVEGSLRWDTFECETVFEAYDRIQEVLANASCTLEAGY